MINVNDPYLPPMEDYHRYLRRIWEANQITNNGPLVSELEERIREYLRVKHVFLVANGTLALMLALKALKAKGEVITTPFSFIATVSGIQWAGCTPVFADIHPSTFCIDPGEIEKRISPQTSVIMGTHIYGGPCDVEAIRELADRHGLKVVYDAAQAFGTCYQGKQLCAYGDISAISFHATQVLSMAEGGALVTNDDRVARKIWLIRYFGLDEHHEIVDEGLNAKSSELHAAMGLANLDNLSEHLDRRTEITGLYDRLLAGLPLEKQVLRANTKPNNAYYPVVFPSENHAVRALKALKDNGIICKRYFYPSLNTVPVLGDHPSMPVAEAIARKVLCLPLLPGLKSDDIEAIVGIIRNLID